MSKTTIRHPDVTGTADVNDKTLAHYKAKGWVVVDGDLDPELPFPVDNSVGDPNVPVGDDTTPSKED